MIQEMKLLSFCNVLLVIFQVGHGQVPGSPTITNVFPQSRSVLVIFTQPSGSVDSYIVEVTSTNDDIPVQRALTVVTTVTSINGLEEALDYIVTVTAVNRNGQGKPATFPFRTSGSIPNGPPLNVTTNVTRTTVILSWQPPSLIYRNTFNSISWYIVKFKQSSIRAFPSEGANVTTTTYTVVGLSPGIEYDFLILAGNEFGVSQDLNGAEATDTTSEDVPAPPRNVTIVTQFTRAIVYWKPPEPSNGQLEEYEVNYYNTRTPSDVKMLRQSAVSLFRLIASLEEGEEFRLKVRASTKAGWGDFSPTQQFTMVRQAVLQDVCSLSDTIIRVVFVYSPLTSRSVGIQGLKVYVRANSSSPYTTHSAVYPQNYVDIPVSSTNTLFWMYSVIQVYSGITVQEELSEKNELFPGTYYQCPKDRVLPTPTAILPHPTTPTNTGSTTHSSSGTTEPTTPCVTIVQGAPAADDHTVFFVAAGVGGVVCVSLIVAIVIIVTVCIRKRGSTSTRSSVRYNIEATDFGRELETDDDNAALIGKQ